MSGATSEPPPTEGSWVDSPHLLWTERVIGWALAVSIGLLVFTFLVLIDLGTWVVTWGSVALIVGMVVGLALGTAFAVGGQHVSRLGLSESGFELRTWFQRIRAPWADLRPSLFYRRGGDFSIRIRLPNGYYTMPYRLSPPQALALLNNPKSPRQLFPPEAWESAGGPMPGSFP